MYDIQYKKCVKEHNKHLAIPSATGSGPLMGTNPEV